MRAAGQPQTGSTVPPLEDEAEEDDEAEEVEDPLEEDEDEVLEADVEDALVLEELLADAPPPLPPAPEELDAPTLVVPEEALAAPPPLPEAELEPPAVVVPEEPVVLDDELAGPLDAAPLEGDPDPPGPPMDELQATSNAAPAARLQYRTSPALRIGVGALGFKSMLVARSRAPVQVLGHSRRRTRD